MQTVFTPNAPTPAGHYSQAVEHGGFVFVAGQLPLDPATGELVGPGDVALQTRQTLRNVAAILEAAGSGLGRMVSVTVYITRRDLWAEVNRVYAEMLGIHRPARAVVPSTELRPGCLIEIQAIAVAGQVDA